MKVLRNLSFIVIFSLYKCISVADSSANFTQEEIKRELESRGYKFFSKRVGYQNNEKVAALELGKNGHYNLGDFEKICSIVNLREVYFDGLDILEINKGDGESCSKFLSG
jgi:hypothetical protein